MPYVTRIFSSLFFSGMLLLAASHSVPVNAAFLQEDDAPEMTERAVKALSKYERSGETVTCLNIRTIQEIKALDDRHLLVRTSGNSYYLNIVTNRCRGASQANNRLQYTTSIGRLCRNEIIQVIDNTTGIFSGSCALGSFERLDEKAEQPEEE